MNSGVATQMQPSLVGQSQIQMGVLAHQKVQSRLGSNAIHKNVNLDSNLSSNTSGPPSNSNHYPGSSSDQAASLNGQFSQIISGHSTFAIQGQPNSDSQNGYIVLNQNIQPQSQK